MVLVLEKTELDRIQRYRRTALKEECLYDTQLFSGCSPEKNLGRFYRVDFMGHPSNFSQGAD